MSKKQWGVWCLAPKGGQPGWLQDCNRERDEFIWTDWTTTRKSDAKGEVSLMVHPKHYEVREYEPTDTPDPPSS